MFMLSVIPVALLLLLIHWGNHHKISTALLIELLLTGATLSCIGAALLEAGAMTAGRKCLPCMGPALQAMDEAKRNQTEGLVPGEGTRHASGPALPGPSERDTPFAERDVTRETLTPTGSSAETGEEMSEMQTVQSAFDAPLEADLSFLSGTPFTDIQHFLVTPRDELMFGVLGSLYERLTDGSRTNEHPLRVSSFEERETGFLSSGIAVGKTETASTFVFSEETRLPSSLSLGSTAAVEAGLKESGLSVAAAISSSPSHSPSAPVSETPPMQGSSGGTGESEGVKTAAGRDKSTETGGSTGGSREEESDPVTQALGDGKDGFPDFVTEKKIDPPSFLCTIGFFIMITLSVGFVEELCKFAVILRVHVKENLVPHDCSCWWRLVETPVGLVVGGCAAGAGFAVLENIMYNFMGAGYPGVLQAVFRGIFAIPFHISGTGYAAARLANFVFTGHDDVIPKVSESRRSVLADTAPDGTGEPAFSTPLTGNGGTPMDLDPARPNDVSVFRYLGFLLIPSILHGVYDASLFGAFIFVLAGDIIKPGLFVLLALASQITMVTLFILAFRGVMNVEQHRLQELTLGVGAPGGGLGASGGPRWGDVELSGGNANNANGQTQSETPTGGQQAV
uniref:Uncharacterized protein n=1 Tax=Chromera velia CCMP2878 TaxID=1169474 RepID=A0A0K6S776_9ALVE|eukprot:Cvel_4381.t1-p1 / transcript=Cvel_4381.t1 / gene=Cvel_4381 / organism=Chromera_velia_CCMP2878 / gene_product=hypothetical protein / transcript_product=hypothetical protein / location=Cvel_scaffold190:24565-30590(+) / protein_length=623 / sequence_SO=supercontig / SO=protein_coding / is_pseudo=false